MTISRPFRPHPLFLGGHLQTLAGFYLPTGQLRYEAKSELLAVSNTDKIALHDDCPLEWSATDKVALLVHGLAGCHRSGYMERLVDRLLRNGVRCFRMDMRGTGTASGMAKEPGHAGRTEDLTVAVEFIAQQCPQAPLTVVGFSMGGNIALATAALSSQQQIGNFVRCIAVSPPVDLSRCCRELQQGVRRLYDRYLNRFLLQAWRHNGGQVPTPCPRSIYEFDDRITAPVSGFRDAEDYYAQSSSANSLVNITIPTTILAARNDPIVGIGAIEQARRSPQVKLVVTKSGGHLGYVGTNRDVENRRWMDWQLCEWIAAS